MSVTLAIGTEKGAFFARSDGDRSAWTVDEPAMEGWKVTAFGTAPDGTHLMAVASNWYGAAVHRSTDLEGWEQTQAGPAYRESEGRRLDQIWCFTTAGSRVYAGVSEAGLFASDDNGVTWVPFTGLNDHETRGSWSPGLGGLCAHHVVVDPADHDRLWVAISAVGVFRSEDGGGSWTPANEGVQQTVPDPSSRAVGYCVHGIVADPADARRMWRQEHRGVFRSEDGGTTWRRIEEGLPASFGFPIVRDPRTGRLFVIPLRSDEYRLPPTGRLAVYRSDDDGEHWERAGSGGPAEPDYSGVLRRAMVLDSADPAGLYFGTTGGGVYASNDTGETWQRLPVTLPRILTVHAFSS